MYIYFSPSSTYILHIFIRSNLQVSDETYKNMQVKERSILKVDTVGIDFYALIKVTFKVEY